MISDLLIISRELCRAPLFEGAETVEEEGKALRGNQNVCSEDHPERCSGNSLKPRVCPQAAG